MDTNVENEPEVNENNSRVPSELYAEVEKMLQMDVVEAEQERARLSDKYEIRKSVVDSIASTVKDHQEDNAQGDVVVDVEPWPEPVDGVLLLDEIKHEIERHVVLPDGAAEAIAVWVLLTYCYNCFRICPYLGIVSPQKRCGKTTLLEILIMLTCRALVASNLSPAAVYRTIEKYHPTLLSDEADTFLANSDELRGVYNSGHTRSSAFVIRCAGEDSEPFRFSTWCPKAIAAIGELPGTIGDRSIIVGLKRKLPSEQRDKLNFETENIAGIIRRRCQRWANDNFQAPVSFPISIGNLGNDRAEDNWAPLATIADRAGGEWPEKIRASAYALNDRVDANRDELPIMLLSDIKIVLDEDSGDRIFSDTLVDRLNNMQDRPWPDLKRGRGLTQASMVRYLTPFGITSKRIRIGSENKRGFIKDLFRDSFDRYLFSSSIPLQGGTAEQDYNINNLDENQTGTEKKLFHLKNRHNPLNLNECSTVPPCTEGAGENIRDCSKCPACDHENDTCYGESFFLGKAARSQPCASAKANCPAVREKAEAATK